MTTPSTTGSLLAQRPYIGSFRVLGPLPALNLEQGRRIWHPFHQRICAVRFVPGVGEEQQRLLRRACQRLARLGHPHLVPLLDLVVLPGSVGIVEGDDGAGYTLRNSLDEMGVLQLDEALGVFRQVVQGIAALHSIGLLHGDLHPGNICLDVVQGNLQVRIRGIGPPMLGLPPTEDRYLAPERITGAPPDRRADVFTLGMMLYECLTGQIPFADEDPLERRKRIRAGELLPLRQQVPNLPIEVGFAVDGALQPDPARRFTDARPFARAFPDPSDPSSAGRSSGSGSNSGPAFSPALEEDYIGIEPEHTDVIDVPEPTSVRERRAAASAGAAVEEVIAPDEGEVTPPAPALKAADLADAIEDPDLPARVEPAAAAGGGGAEDDGEIDPGEHTRPEAPESTEEVRRRAQLGARSVDLVLQLGKAARIVAIPLLLVLVFVAFMSADGFVEAREQEERIAEIEDSLGRKMEELAALAAEAEALGVEPNAVRPMLADYRSAQGWGAKHRAAETMASGLLRMVRSMPETQDLQLRERRSNLERRIGHLMGELNAYQNGQIALERSAQESFGAWLSRFFR